MSRNPYSASTDASFDADKYLSNAPSSGTYNTSSTDTSGYVPPSTLPTATGISTTGSVPPPQTHPIYDEFSSTAMGTAHSTDATPLQGGYTTTGQYSSTGTGLTDTKTNPFSTEKDLSRDPAYDTYGKTTGTTTSATDQTKDAAYGTYDQAASKTASAKDQTVNNAAAAYNTTADKATYAKDQTLSTANDAYNKTADNALYAKEQTKQTANDAYNKTAQTATNVGNAAADTAASAKVQAQQTATSASNRIQDVASQGLAAVSNLVSQAYNAATATTNNAVDNAKQTAAQTTDAVKQTHQQISDNSRTTPVTSSTGGGILSLEEIMKHNDVSQMNKEPEPEKPPQPKMVYAMAADDGSVKVLGQIPDGVSKEQMDSATGNYVAKQEARLENSQSSNTGVSGNTTEGRVPGGF